MQRTAALQWRSARNPDPPRPAGSTPSCLLLHVALSVVHERNPCELLDMESAKLHEDGRRTQPKHEAKKIQPNSRPLLLHIVTMEPSRFFGTGTACDKLCALGGSHGV